MATALLKAGVDLSGVSLKITAGAGSNSSYTPKVVFTTDLGAYLSEYEYNNILGLTLHMPNSSTLSIYDPSEDSIPHTVVLPAGVGVIVELDEDAESYPYIERSINDKIYGFTEDMARVDLTAELGKLGSMISVVESGIMEDTQTSQGVSLSLVEAYKVYSDNTFECDINVSAYPSFSYVSSHLFRSPELSFDILKNRLAHSINGIYTVDAIARGSFNSGNDPTVHYIMQVIKVGNGEVGGVDSLTLQAFAFNPADNNTGAKSMNVTFSVRVTGTVSAS